MRIKKVVLVTLTTVMCVGFAAFARGQDVAVNAANKAAVVSDRSSDDRKSDKPATKPDTAKPGSTVEEQLASLIEKMNKLETVVEDQQKTIDELRRERNADIAGASTATGDATTAANSPAGEPLRRTPRPQSDEPLTFHIGSATITPVGQAELTGFFRTRTLGSGVGTSFGALPFDNVVQGNLSETRLSAQNSRFGFRVDAKIHDWDVIGFMEAELLGNDAANVFVSANRHTPALRHYWVDARRGKFEILAGQTWSLLTPNRTGLSPVNEDVFTTRVIDPNYHVGLSWARQAQLRFVLHASDQWTLGVSAENPEQFVGAGEVIFPFAFNAALGTQFDANNQTAAPNLMPDFVGKVAYDAKGNRHIHVEFAGIFRDFRITNVQIFSGSGGFVHHTQFGTGEVVNADIEVFKNVHFVSNNFLSSGGGRYTGGLGPDLVVGPIAIPGGFDLGLTPVRSFSSLQGFEAQVSPHWLLYGYYGGVYYRRNAFPDATSPLLIKPIIGFGGTNSPNSANRTIQEVTGGVTRTVWSDPRYGALEFSGQISYLVRSPWFVAPGAPINANLSMGMFSLRYVLPGKSPKSSN